MRGAILIKQKSIMNYNFQDDRNGHNWPCTLKSVHNGQSIIIQMDGANGLGTVFGGQAGTGAIYGSTIGEEGYGRGYPVGLPGICIDRNKMLVQLNIIQR